MEGWQEHGMRGWRGVRGGAACKRHEGQAQGLTQFRQGQSLEVPEQKSDMIRTNLTTIAIWQHCDQWSERGEDGIWEGRREIKRS